MLTAMGSLHRESGMLLASAQRELGLILAHCFFLSPQINCGDFPHTAAAQVGGEKQGNKRILWYGAHAPAWDAQGDPEGQTTLFPTGAAHFAPKQRVPCGVQAPCTHLQGKYVPGWRDSQRCPLPV